MPKVENLNLKQKIVRRFSEKVFMTDGKIIFYKLCEIEINSHEKYNIQQHIVREKHKGALVKHEAGKNNAIQPIRSTI